VVASSHTAKRLLSVQRKKGLRSIRRPTSWNCGRDYGGIPAGTDGRALHRGHVVNRCWREVAQTDTVRVLPRVGSLG
jgi:hypothetical protein